MPAVPTRRVCRQEPFAGMPPRPQAAAACSQCSLLPVVDPLVLDELGTLAKGLAAGAAGEGPLTGVGPQVPEEVRAAAEGLATVRAGKGLLARVGVEMLHQGGAPGETLPAHVAAMPPVGSGDWRVGREWRATPARHLRWLLPTIRKASREGFESRQPGKLSVHRRNLPQCLPPSSLSFFCLISGNCRETRGELRPQLILVLDAHTHYGIREAS